MKSLNDEELKTERFCVCPCAVLNDHNIQMKNFKRTKSEIFSVIIL